MIFHFLHQREKKWLLLFLSCLFFWWVLGASAIVSASGTYTITEQELTYLESSLSRLSSINSNLQMESQKQKTQATKLQEQVKLLQNQLTTLQTESMKQQELLTAANNSLEQFAIEEKNKRLKIKAQRNTYFCLMVAAAVAAVIHR